LANFSTLPSTPSATTTAESLADFSMSEYSNSRSCTFWPEER
jgi:hypothetical protein